MKSEKTVLELEDLANKAIKAALSQEWKEAIKLNLEYLEESPNSIEAGNRLGRAYQENGQPQKAKQAFKQVLTLDPYNAIAQKNLDKLGSGSKSSSTQANSQIFLEEPGKTRTVTLENPKLEMAKNLTPGQELTLTNRKGLIALLDSEDNSFGSLEENLANHLSKLIALGNTYSAHVVQASDESIQVILRETHQSSAASKYVSFTKSPSLLNHLGSIGNRRSADDLDGPDTTTTEDESDNWDADSTNASDISDDEFASVSLEQLKDDEDSGFNNEY